MANALSRVAEKFWAIVLGELDIQLPDSSLETLIATYD